MRAPLIMVGIGAIILIIGGYFASQYTQSSPGTSDTMGLSMAEPLTLTSSAFGNEQAVPPKYTCDASPLRQSADGGMSPPISWSGVPEDTQSFVLIMDDPDAPGSGWDHWLAFNIPPTVRGVEEGSEPEGVPGKNSWGRGGYGGPCPPSGTHRYYFRLYALDTMLGLSEGASKSDVLAAMGGHVLAEAKLMGKYQRTSQ